MTRVLPIRFVLPLMAAAIFLSSAIPAKAQTRRPKNHPAAARARTAVAPAAAPAPEGRIIGTQVNLADGSSIRADEVWKQGEQVWFRIGKVSQSIDRPIKSIEPIRAEVKNDLPKTEAPSTTLVENKTPASGLTWLLLKGGARIKVDEIAENDAGAWFRRGNVSIFVERDRIDRVERDSAEAKQPTGWIERGWTTGNGKIDDLIRVNATRFSLDPYLVFCVIEHESHFQTHALSPKGARGLMQLMPGTARRFGVRRPFDPAENIFGGTQYLKELLQMFGGRLDLALASYNAGEGAVIKYGRTVPPYRETRDYVKRLTKRYGADTTAPGDKPSSPR